MGKKKTHEEYVNELRVANPNVSVVDAYINANTAIEHYCITHDEIWSTTPSRALSGVGCPKCKHERFRNVRCKTHEQFVKEVSIANPDVVVCGEYIDARTKIEFYCKKHDVYWMAYPDNILRGCGCTMCAIEKSAMNRRKSHEQYVFELSKINDSIDVVEEYSGANTPILHKCKVDGHIWSASPANVLSGKGCPKCNLSHGEKQIYKWLLEHDIEFEEQKTFDGCRSIRPLPFDFYLPNYNACIEYDGLQHFQPIDHFGGEEALKIRICHDEIKNQYCQNNNIDLLRIPYYANINEELEGFFIH